MQTCNGCRQLLSKSAFTKNKNVCAKCRKDDECYRRFGFSWFELVYIYGDKCNICGNKETAKVGDGDIHRLCIDHDHNCCKSGCRDCIRGLLCRTCNYQLGVLEKEEWKIKALVYLGRRRIIGDD